MYEGLDSSTKTGVPLHYTTSSPGATPSPLTDKKNPLPVDTGRGSPRPGTPTLGGSDGGSGIQVNGFNPNVSSDRDTASLVEPDED